MDESDNLVGFEARAPSHQNAVDIFAGSWSSRFPPSSGLVGGLASHFDDVRVTWAASILEGIGGLSILELGPFEAYNTYQFQAFGAATVVSVESSRVNFLKCLIVKNTFGLNATFLHGNFQDYLASTRNRFDVCWASGVLYHMVDPIALMQGLRRVADTAFIWTQYYDADVLVDGANARFFDASRDKIVDFAGRSICLHHRNYDESASSLFAGGDASFSYWMERGDIMFVLQTLGYLRIDMGIDNPQHPPGPAMFFLARSSPETTDGQPSR